jgi:aspartate aminotransferase
MLVHFDRRRLKLLEGLNGIEGVTCERAQAAFYLFPNMSSFGLSAEEFSARLLEERNVAVVPGHAFGAEGYVRLSYATSDEVIQKGIERLDSFCSSL